MSDHFSPISIEQLLSLILNEYHTKKQILGFPEPVFVLQNNTKFKSELFGQPLGAPIGVAAGPHSQMAQNLIAAWICGARYFELKTVQELDELSISKPCIDMQDEGYNCEWSQELKIEASFNQYLDAWIIIHILNHKFNGNSQPMVQFNMSVGYNLQGIMGDKVQRFLSKMANAENELQVKIAQLKPYYPDIESIAIPSQLANSITLSTMHGCPPHEIEQIATYLIEQKKLHTYVKLNPTLLGADKLRDILNKRNKFSTIVPDEAFDHDLKYADAIPMIKRLKDCANKNGVDFGLKLTNTLESKNIKTIFNPSEAMMYMSGRALHPLSVNLAHLLQNEFNGELSISFAGGADCFNYADILTCGLTPVTVCSDLLKPGGYGRLKQYTDRLNEVIASENVGSIEELVLKKAGNKRLNEARLINLTSYTQSLKENESYQRSGFSYPSVKTDRNLGYFDCIKAPCQENCATQQNIPDYLHFTANGEFNNAFESILLQNPQPAITGHICDHQCQLKCTRINYDDPLLIREIKRFVNENHNTLQTRQTPHNGKKVAIIGAGPSGLSCAWYLLKNGFQVDIFDQKDKAGGMVSAAVPYFRIDDQQILKDISRVEDAGAKITYNQHINKEQFNLLVKNYDFVYLAIGAQRSLPLNIPNDNLDEVISALDFLYQARYQKGNIAGKHVVIVGGGNSAMDAARSAFRLVGPNGKVTVIYRRTIADMPADLGEIKAVLAEQIPIVELTLPIEILKEKNKVTGIKCIKTQLFKSENGKMIPQPVIGSEFIIKCEFVVAAIGQKVESDFLTKADSNKLLPPYATMLPNVFIGGDAYRGAATAIKAIADGKKVASIMVQKAGLSPIISRETTKAINPNDLYTKRFYRINGQKARESSISDRQNFKPVSFTLSKEAAMLESERCLQCDQLCNVCVTVCPNRANYSYTVPLVNYPLQKIKCENNNITYEPDKVFSINQSYQVLNIGDFCNECGNCTTFCPTEGKPFRDKPRLYLSIQSFNNKTEGFYFSKLPQKNILIFKEDGGIRTLERFNNEWIYETDHIWAKFNTTDFSIIEIKIKTPCVKQAHFAMAAEMSVVYTGAEQLFNT